MTFCLAPTTQLHFDPLGDVAVCSRSTHRRLGSIATDDLRELWLGPGIAAVRDALAQEIFPDGCEVCAWHAAKGNFADHPARSFDERRLPADPAWPSHLEFAFTNACNLACVQCSPELSSRIRAERGLPPQPSVYGDRFFAQIEPFLAHAMSISLLGGEPFLQRECFRLFDFMIRSGLRIPIHVTTNGTRLDADVERILEKLKVHVAFSLDGVTVPTIERIRVGASGEALLANLRRFAAIARERRRQLTLNFCLMRENWSEMPDLFLLAQSLGAGVWVTPVTHPREHSLFTRPPAELAAILQAWRARAPEALRDADETQRRKWQSLDAMFERASQSADAADVGETWWTIHRVAAALGRLAADEEAALRELERFAREGLGAATAVDLLVRLIRSERAGDAGGDAFLTAADALARLAAKSPYRIGALHPGGPMEVARRLAAAGLPATSAEFAACTPPSDPEHRRALLSCAAFHFDRRQTARSRACLEEVARHDGPSAEGLLRLAWIELHEGRDAAADAAVTEGESLARGDAALEPWVALGLERARAHVLVRLRATARASAAIDRLLARDPGDAEARALERILAESTASGSRA